MVERPGDSQNRGEHRTSAAYLTGNEPSDAPSFRVQGQLWTVGAVLAHSSETGTMPEQYLSWAIRRQGLFDLRGATKPAHALFPSIDEVLNLMALLVCERGFNQSVMNFVSVDFSARQIQTLRGPSTPWAWINLGAESDVTPARSSLTRLGNSGAALSP